MIENKRVKMAINWLISQGLFSSQKEIGEMMGITNRSYLSQLVNATTPNIEFINKFITVAPQLNREWLMTGEGEMLKPKGTDVNQNARLVGGVFSAGQHDEGVVMVDFVPVTATATFIESLTDGSDSELEKYPLIPRGNERNDMDSLKIFEVEGDSMFPTIPSRSLILAKEIPESSWHYAEGVVVAVFSDYVVVKRVARNCLLTENYIVLRSDNEDYGEMTVALSDLRGLYRAKRIISSEIS